MKPLDRGRNIAAYAIVEEAVLVVFVDVVGFRIIGGDRSGREGGVVRWVLLVADAEDEDGMHHG